MSVKIWPVNSFIKINNDIKNTFYFNMQIFYMKEHTVAAERYWFYKSVQIILRKYTFSP